jgi:autotransporter-associated beta strand protein
LSTGGHPYKLIKTGGNQVSLVAVCVDPELGDIDIQQGLMGWETATSSMGNPASNLIVRAGATLSFYNADTAWNKHFILYGNGVSTNLYNWSGANVIIGPMQLHGDCVFWGGGTSLLLSNVVSGTGSLIKNGSYRLRLAAPNTYVGQTVVNDGSLILLNAGAIASSATVNVGAGAVLDASGRNDGTFTLAAGQTLTGNGSVNGDVVISAGGVLKPGNAVGTLAFNNNLILNSGSRTVMKIAKWVSPSNDVVQVAGNINYGGTLAVTNVGGIPFAAGDSFKLFNAADYSGAFTQIAPAIPALNLAWDTNGLTNGILRVVSLPTPPPKFGGLNWRGNQLVFRGSNGVPGWMYYLLASTNLGRAPAHWRVISTNSFDPEGNFIFTNAGTTNVPQMFYRLELP